MTAGVRVEEHTGPREALRASFALAEDSERELATYFGLGRVLVARDGDGRLLGHLQLAGDEVKNMAVAEDVRGRGIGRALIDAAVALARSEGVALLRVATAAADVGNLRFYQRLGFRMQSVERDAFTEATGYPPGIEVDGIPLRDRVWLDRAL